MTNLSTQNDPTNTSPARVVPATAKETYAPPLPLLEALQARLLMLPFDAFAQVIALLLSKLGYEPQRTGRTLWKGRNRDGGCDLLASYPWGQSRRVVAVQIKQYPTVRKIMQRTVDELRGVCLRHNASEGLLITTSSYSPTITGTTSLIAPLYLMQGSELTFLLAQYCIGVTKSWQLDEQFFDDLEKASQATEKASQDTGKAIGSLRKTTSSPHRPSSSLLKKRRKLLQHPGQLPQCLGQSQLPDQILQLNSQTLRKLRVTISLDDK